jgi:hypothetical protein
MAMQSRRSFLGSAAILVAASAWSTTTLAAQTPRQGGPIPWPLEPWGGPVPDRQGNPDDQLKRNQAKIKKNMERLKEVVAELQKQLEADNPTKVLSMTAVRETEEIEKLARDIRGLMRG